MDKYEVLQIQGQVLWNPGTGVVESRIRNFKIQGQNSGTGVENSLKIQGQVLKNSSKNIWGQVLEYMGTGVGYFIGYFNIFHNYFV